MSASPVAVTADLASPVIADDDYPAYWQPGYGAFLSAITGTDSAPSSTSVENAAELFNRDYILEYISSQMTPLPVVFDETNNTVEDGSPMLFYSHLRTMELHGISPLTKAKVYRCLQEAMDGITYEQLLDYCLQSTNVSVLVTFIREQVVQLEPLFVLPPF